MLHCVNPYLFLIQIPCIRSEITMTFRNALVTLQNYWEIHGDATINIADLIRQEVDELEGQNKIGIQESTVTIAKAVSLFKDTDVFCGLLMVLSGVATLNPTTGPIVCSLIQLASTVINKLCDEQVGSAVYGPIDQALARFSDEELRAKVAGTVKIFKTGFAFLSVRNKKPSVADISMLMSNVPITTGVYHLGNLYDKINKRVHTNDKNEALRAIEYIHMYVKLAILRTCLFESLYSIVVRTPGSEDTAKRIRSVINQEKEDDGTLLSFLTNYQKRSYSQKVLLTYLYPSTMPIIGLYLQHLGLGSFGDGINRTFTFTTEEITVGLTRSWWFNPFNDGYMGSNNKTRAEYDFRFEVISEVDNLFYIRSVSEPRVYIYMENSPFAQCSASKSRPESNGQWKLISFNSGYAFSNKRWPDWFIGLEITDNNPNMDLGYASDTITYRLKGYDDKYSIFHL